MKIVVDATLLHDAEFSGQAIVTSLSELALDMNIVISSSGDLTQTFGKNFEVSPLAFVPLILSHCERGQSGLVVALSASQSHLLEIANSRGVLPILLRYEGDSQNKIHDNDSPIVILQIGGLKRLLLDPSAKPLLSLYQFDFIRHASDHEQELVSCLERINEAGGLSIYGAGTIGRQALTAAKLINLPVKAFIDMNPLLQGTLIDSIPVIAPHQLQAKHDVVVPALGRHLSQVREVLSGYSVEIFTLSNLFYLSQTPSECEKDYWCDLQLNKCRYVELFLRLADQRSRDVLSAVIQHRIALDPIALEEVCERGHPQWFDPQFLPEARDSVFVDGGAFDGDTVEAYIKAQGMNYRSIYAFELDPVIARRGKLRLQNYSNVHYQNIGLSNQSSQVHIRSTGGTDGGFHGHGTVSKGGERATEDSIVSVVSLDELVIEAINYLKL
jgi:hypothetical protein